MGRMLILACAIAVVALGNRLSRFLLEKKAFIGEYYVSKVNLMQKSADKKAKN